MHFTRRSPSRSLLWLLLVVAAWPQQAAVAQVNPVYVDDSPQAWELFQQAVDQSKDNTGEAVRLFQQLLDDYPLRLIPAFASADGHYRSVRQRVNAQLSGSRLLLERYQLIASAEAVRMLEAGELQALAISRAMTRSGLEAMLQLAQHDLERARFASAISWLDEVIAHPAISTTQEAHAWYMLGMAAAYSGDLTKLGTARNALRAIGEEAAEHLEQLDAIGSLDNLPGSQGISLNDISQAGDLRDVVAHSIWTVTLDKSLIRRRLYSSGDNNIDMLNPVLQQRRSTGVMMTAAPTVLDSTVYISEGHRITALDRFTGRVLWTHDNPPSMLSRGDSTSVQDMNTIVVQDGTLVTIYGHAQETDRSEDGRIACLDAATGDRRWIRRINRIGGVDEYDGLFAYGSPIIADGSVYLLARKVSQQNLTSVYVLSLDARDGSLQWIRYITSSGTVRRSPGRPMSSMIYRDGHLVVASPIGSIAKLKARTGQIDWLRRYNVPMTLPYQDRERRPWEISTAAWTPRGIVAMRPDLTRVMLLDHDTGEEIASYPSSPNDAWGAPHYLLSNDRMVFGVGRDIRAFHIDDLQVPMWQLPAPAVSQLDGMERASDFAPEVLSINGRVQLTDSALVVPSSAGVFIVDHETGFVQQTLDLRDVAGGNPLASDSQLLLADSDHIHAFMSFARAEQMLRNRLDENAADPEPALSLVRLGRRVRDLSLMLEATELAIERIDRNVPAIASEGRAELFSLLLAVDEDLLADDAERANAFFSQLGRVATSDTQRAEHRLAWGDWLADHDPAEAVAVYQQLLSDPDLSLVMRTEDDLIKSGARWAAERLALLVGRAGEAVYARQSEAASSMLRELRADGRADPDQLLAFADQYPFAPAAVDARLQAAAEWHANGEQARAMFTLLDGYRWYPSDAAASTLLAQYIAKSVERGGVEDAWNMLSYVRARHTTTPLQAEGKARRARQWQDELAGALPPERVVRMGNISGMGEAIPGIVAPRIETHTSARQHGGSLDSFLIEVEGRLSMIDGKTLARRWTADVEVVVPRVLRDTADELVIWVATNPEDPHAVGLDPATGEIRWTSARLADVIGDVVADLNRGRALREQLPNGQTFDPRQTLPLIARDRLVLARRTGGVAGFDAADASAPLWTRRNVLEQVHFALMNEHVLILAGTIGAQGARRGEPVIMGLNPDSGETLWLSRTLGGQGLRWIVDAGFGRVVCGSQAGIVARDLFTGEPLWANVSYTAADVQRAWPVGGNVLIETQSSLQAINARTGKLVAPFEGPVNTDWNPFDVQEVVPVPGEDFAFVRYTRRIVMFTSEGRVLGADIVNEDRDYLWMVPTADRLIVVSGRAEQSLVPDASGRRTQYFYRIYTMSRNGKLLDRPHELPPMRRKVFHVDVVNGRILMTADNNQTLVVPAPAQ